MSDLSLAKIDAVLVAINEAATVQEIKHTLDMANAAQIYAQQAKVGKDIELRTAEYVIRAERKLGELLESAKATGQITKVPPHNQSHVPDENMCTFTLEQAGIDRKLSSRAQKIAAVPEAEFEQAISKGKQTGKLSKSLFSRNGKARAQTNIRSVRLLLWRTEVHNLLRTLRMIIREGKKPLQLTEQDLAPLQKFRQKLRQIAAQNGWDKDNEDNDE
jgi:hypothetical protein